MSFCYSSTAGILFIKKFLSAKLIKSFEITKKKYKVFTFFLCK